MHKKVSERLKKSRNNKDCFFSESVYSEILHSDYQDLQDDKIVMYFNSHYLRYINKSLDYLEGLGCDRKKVKIRIQFAVSDFEGMVIEKTKIIYFSDIISAISDIRTVYVSPIIVGYLVVGRPFEASLDLDILYGIKFDKSDLGIVKKVINQPYKWTGNIVSDFEKISNSGMIIQYAIKTKKSTSFYKAEDGLTIEIKKEEIKTPYLIIDVSKNSISYSKSTCIIF